MWGRGIASYRAQSVDEVRAGGEVGTLVRRNAVWKIRSSLEGSLMHIKGLLEESHQAANSR